MRIFLLRLLIGWWLIPLIYLMFLPFSYMLTGDYFESVNDVKKICKILWYGIE